MTHLGKFWSDESLPFHHLGLWSSLLPSLNESLTGGRYPHVHCPLQGKGNRLVHPTPDAYSWSDGLSSKNKSKSSSEASTCPAPQPGQIAPCRRAGQFLPHSSSSCSQCSLWELCPQVNFKRISPSCRPRLINSLLLIQVSEVMWAKEGACVVAILIPGKQAHGGWLACSPKAHCPITSISCSLWESQQQFATLWCDKYNSFVLIFNLHIYWEMSWS